jgi:surfeit locus 1 family protein
VKRYAPLVVGLLAATLFVRLGVWQLERRSERRAFNAETQARSEEPPLDAAQIPRTNEASDSLRFRRAAASGTFDFGRQLVVMARGHRGNPGVYVVTPLVLADSTAVLVERGWVFSPDGRTVELTSVSEPDSADVRGVLVGVSSLPAVTVADSTWPRHVRRVDPEALAPDYPYALRSLVLRRTELPEHAPTVLRAVQLPGLTEGPHLSYAIQWFAFALIALVGSFLLYRRY